MLHPFVFYMMMMMMMIVAISDVLTFDTEGAEVLVVSAVRGGEAVVPCGGGGVFLDGPSSYVLWINNDQDILYRYPNEHTNTSWEHVATCAGAGCGDVTSLVLRHVTERDAGRYRCRVHYQASPSVDYIIELRLVDSPGVPRIYNSNGATITSGYVGPVGVGDDVTLVCEVDDGGAQTQVWWRREGAVLSRAQYVRVRRVWRAELIVHGVTRADHRALYECVARAGDVTKPLVATVQLHMYLAPLSVEIRLNNNVEFEAGQPRVVDCVVIGCVPPPMVTWHLGDTALRPTVHKEVHDGNYTVSSLTLTAGLRDDGRVLVCRAHNARLQGVVFDDRVTINVGYLGRCVTEGVRVCATRGASVSVTCKVRASPAPAHFTWTFPDETTVHTTHNRVPGERHVYTSTVTWVSRDNVAGLLLCRATNALGEQKQPCTFTISPEVSPLAPECVAITSQQNDLTVQCKKGWDGACSQTVHLEVSDESGAVLYNMSDSAGQFHVSRTDTASNITARVYSMSASGRSEARVLRVCTPRSSHSSVVQWAGSVGGVGALVCVGAVAVCVCIAVRARRRHTDRAQHNDGLYHRESDVTRDERTLAATNITVTSHTRYAPAPMVGCAPHSYYV